MGILRKAWGGFGVELLVNFALPYLVYLEAKPGMGRVHALMLSSVPPIIWSLIQLVRNRRVDALSILVIAGIGLSLIAFLGGGSYRFLELREHLVTGLVGVVFLGSVAIKRPLLYEIARAAMRRKSQAEAEKFEQIRDKPQFRRFVTVMTVVMGLWMLVQTGIAIFLVYTMPVHEFLIVGPIVHYVLLGALILVIFLYAGRQKRRAAAARAAHGQRASS